MSNEKTDFTSQIMIWASKKYKVCSNWGCRGYYNPIIMELLSI